MENDLCYQNFDSESDIPKSLKEKLDFDDFDMDLLKNIE